VRSAVFYNDPFLMHISALSRESARLWPILQLVRYRESRGVCNLMQGQLSQSLCSAITQFSSRICHPGAGKAFDAAYDRRYAKEAETRQITSEVEDDPKRGISIVALFSRRI
jgi:hypothetical protein